MNRFSCRAAVRAPALAALLLFAVPAAMGDIRLPAVLASHMVLQRDMATPVWGWADPGEEVSVRFAGQTKQAKADPSGAWRTRLDPLKSSDQGRPLEIEGQDKVVLENVLVGDVWICSGQSNMEWRVTQSLNGAEEIKSAEDTAIRLFNVPSHVTSSLPLTGGTGSWAVCSPKSVPRFSAVGYFFARTLRQTGRGVPIGLIGTNWGGTRIEPWTPPVGFRSVPELQQIAERVNGFDPTTEAGKTTWKEYLDRVEKWSAGARAAIDSGGTFSPLPAVPGFTNAGQPTAIYNAMVHPLRPFGVRGAIWYQGESNGSEGIEYFHKMQAMINGWRQTWGQGDEFPMYFYFVQLANFQQPSDKPAAGNGYAGLRDAQRKALAIKHTGMAVTIDIGAASDIHPRNKQDVGSRLAQWALRDIYKQDVVPSGPLFKEAKPEDGKLRVHFEHVGGGLIVGVKNGLKPVKESGGSLKRFAVAGEDRQWHWATAVIDNDTILVSSDQVPSPVAVRYAYSMNPAGANLYNQAGLPASPFRSDDW